MKPSRLFFVTLLVSLAATTIRADTVPTDARIIVGHGLDPRGCGTGLPDFRINANGNGGGVINCQNTSGQVWVGLTITGTINRGQKINVDDIKPPGTDIVFTSYTTTTAMEPDGKELVTITLAKGEITADSVNCDIATSSQCANSFFFIDLNTDGSLLDHSGNWEGQLTVTPRTPEPATLILVLTGLGGLWFRQKRGLSPETKV